MSTAPRLVEEIAELPVEVRYPEGIWRVPIEFVLPFSTSVYVEQVRKRQARGNYPFTDCAVFLHAKRFWASIDWPRADGGNECLQLVMPLDIWPWENRDAPVVFGKRQVRP